MLGLRYGIDCTGLLLSRLLAYFLTGIYTPRGGPLATTAGSECPSSRLGAMAPRVRRPLLWAVDMCRSSHVGLLRGE